MPRLLHHPNAPPILREASTPTRPSSDAGNLGSQVSKGIQSSALHLIITKCRIKLMSSSMGWEREFSLFHKNDVVLTYKGLAPSMPLS